MIHTHLLFPTPVFTSYYETNQNVQEYLNSIEYRDVDKTYIKNFGESSKETYVLDKPVCDNLRTHIINISTDIMKNGLSIQTNKAKLTQSWISVKLKNQSHGVHNHPNSILSGVYYYDNYDEDVEPLLFHKNNFSTTYELQVGCFIDPNPLTSEVFTIKPVNGLIVLFPSYVRHSVGCNNSDISRKCLAFNLIPEEGFGSIGGFSELFIKTT
jgi:uncharacterized protein (TIGR02466 family)